MDGDVAVAIVMANTMATGTNLEVQNGTPTDVPHDWATGDSLVPYDETMQWLGEDVSPFVKTITGPIREHAFLFDDPTVMNTVLQALG
jgi:hypothetical protein